MANNNRKRRSRGSKLMTCQLVDPGRGEFTPHGEGWLGRGGSQQHEGTAAKPSKRRARKAVERLRARVATQPKTSGYHTPGSTNSHKALSLSHTRRQNRKRGGR